MNLHLLHTISGVLIVLFLVSKTALHYYLDHQQNSAVSFIYTLLNPVKYLLPYRAAVHQQLKQLKHICNWLLALSFIALLLNLLLGLLIWMN